MTTKASRSINWKRVVICGDRDWSNMDAITNRVRALARRLPAEFDDLIVIEGGAPGADQMAGVAAEQENVHHATVRALWATRHRGAGPQRNEAMAALLPHEVYGFHNNIKKSKGTRNMLDLAHSLGVKTYLYEHGRTKIYVPA